MISSKVKTQKTLSAILGVAIAVVTLFQAGNANSHEAEFVSAEEAALIAEVEAYIEENFAAEEIEMSLEDQFILELEELEAATESVKVYNENNELIGSGNPDTNPLLNKLVNQADYLSEMGGEKYYKITE